MLALKRRRCCWRPDFRSRCGSSLLILILTTVFGLIKPMVAGSWSSLTGIPFTFFAGIALAIGLWAVARFASARVASFVVSLLAVQCVLNALLDLKTVFFLSSPFATTVPTDALNMANATGVPALIWATVWITIAIGILVLALRSYVAGRAHAFPPYSDMSLQSGAPMWPVSSLP